MDGPGHYREAERCAREAAASDYQGKVTDARIWTGLGQLHAAIAGVALHAAAETVRLGALPPAALAGWEEIGTALPEAQEGSGA